MVQKTEFRYPSSDKKTLIRALRWTPGNNVKPSAILQIVHGMQEFIDRYDDFASYMALNGFIVTGQDLLGHGGSVRNGDYRYLGYFGRNNYPGKGGKDKGEKDGTHILLNDIRHLQLITEDLYPGLPFCLLGHSMGSFLARQYLCVRGSSLRACIISGTACHSAAEAQAGLSISNAIASLRGWFYRSPFLNNMSLGLLNKRFEPARTPVDWLSRDTAITDAYVSDKRTQFVFTCNGFYTMFRSLKYLTSKENLMRMPRDLPVLFVSGKEDPVGSFGKDPVKIAEQFRSLGMRRVKCIIYPQDRHEVLNELNKEQVYSDIIRFLREALFPTPTQKS